MQEARGNIFHTECDAVCITTNGFVKTNGQNVMGRGCAKEAARIIPELPGILGDLLARKGNSVHPLVEQNGVVLCSFPVKPVSQRFTGENAVRHMQSRFNPGDLVPGWACLADVEIIQRSARELVKLTEEMRWRTVVLPQPGCGAGELSWAEVKPLLQEILDDRFCCMTF